MSPHPNHTRPALVTWTLILTGWSDLGYWRTRWYGRRGHLARSVTR